MESHIKVAQQLALEEYSRGLGIDQYNKERLAQDETALTPGRTLLRAAVERVATAIRAERTDLKAGRGNRARYEKYFAEFSPEVLAYIASRTCINLVAHDDAPTLTRVAMSISELLHEHKLFTQLRAEHPNLYNYVENQINNTSAKRQRWAMRKATNLAENTVAGLEWADGDKLLVGLRLVELVATHTGLIEDKTISLRKRKRRIVLICTEKMRSYLETRHSGLEDLTPMFKPMVIQPLPWTNPKDGGYLTHDLDLIKGTRHETIDEYFSADMPEVYDAINALQDTAWTINNGILTVLEEAWHEGVGLGGLPLANGEELPTRPYDIPKNVPVSELAPDMKMRLNKWRAETAETHSRNAGDTSRRLALILQLNTAREYRDEREFFFPYQLDFRGRVYPVPTLLNPQADNAGKALLQFAKGKPLGENGAFWLAVHLANEYGYDKTSFDQRVEWTERNEELILNSAINPLDGARFWTEAEHPWTFLAACQEWAGFKVEGTDYVSYIPIGMDGSCSGLQHFSALLRDPVGGAAVNLLPSGDEKSDIYQTVADAVVAALEDPALDAKKVAAWKGHVTRKIVKQPCMTFAYSSTIHGMKNQIVMAMRKGNINLGIDRHEAAMFLAPIVRACIQKTVVAASDALAWLQSVAQECNDAELPILWHNPVGLPVLQDRRRYKGYRVACIYQGRRVRLMLSSKTVTLDNRAQVAGISPNFVHSLDSAHLVKTVNRCTANGIKLFAMIHDSFGTHACDVDMMNLILRREFVDMYKTDWLDSLRVEVQEQLGDSVTLDAPPAFGTLDMEKVMESDFFFC